MATKTQRRLYQYLEQNAIENKFHISTKKELADSLDVSISALSNNLKKLEEENKIVTVSKRGKNGGVVITLVRDYNTEELKEFNESKDNIITSDLQYAKELREKHFPSYRYERKEQRRRTKLEMAQYNAIKDEERRIIADMNFHSEGLPYPSKEVFNMSYDPEGFYKAYILCKLYDQYAISHMDAKHTSHLKAMSKAKTKDEYDYHQHMSEYYRNKMIQNLPRNSVSDNFFGSKTFNTFYNFYLKVKDKNINVFKYMQNVFKNVTFYYENGMQPNPIPSPNFFSSDKYFKNYNNYIKGIKKGINNTNRHLGDTDSAINSSDYVKNPAVLHLHQLYTTGLNYTLHDIDIMFEQALDLENASYGLFGDMKHIVLLQYNSMIEEEVKNLPEEERGIINKYVKQCIINEYSPTSISPSTRLSMFTMQKEHIVSSKQLNGGISREDLLPLSLGGIVNKDSLSGMDIQNLEQNGNEYLYMRQFTSTYYILRMFGDYLGYEVNLREVKYIVEKYNLIDKIPLTKEGMLDYNKLIHLVEEEVNNYE